MRLFVNRKEIPVLSRALILYGEHALTLKDYETMKICSALAERVSLCERLQESERKAGKIEINMIYGTEGLQ